MLCHLFRSIDQVFRPNIETDNLCKEPISTKKLSQGDADWSTKKTVLGWESYTLEHHLRLTPKRESKVCAALDEIPAAANKVSLHKWGHLLGLLRSTTPAIAGAQGMFTRLQHALQKARGIQVQLLPIVHNKISAWCQIVQELAARPTHLRELHPFPPTWEGATDTSRIGMEGVYQTLDIQWFVWRPPFAATTQTRLCRAQTLRGT